ncbi:hypothetical protein DXG01_013422 [Tephrocybe rancida]|nr:hypothetical protein DXG01_013422 [Tephrocybe rancida]
MSTNIFLTGATGYIGGSVLARFLQRPDAASLNFTLLVRSPEKAAKLATLGLKAVIGSHTDAELVERLASEADVAVSTADSDYLPAIQAILRGFEKRYKTTGNAPILIQTSGTGVLADKAAGEYTYDTIYDDANSDQIATLPVTQQHRWVDVELDAADAKGYVKSYIILPSNIYGIATHNLVELGISNPRSTQLPLLIDAALDRGQAGTVGAGKNIWNDVHIDDCKQHLFDECRLDSHETTVADLYNLLYESIKTNPAGTGHGREGYYFGENGSHTLYEVGKAIADELVALGSAKSHEPTPFTREEIDKYFGADFADVALGSNSRAVAHRSRSIGWRPKYTTKDFLASVPAEFQAALKKN